MSGKPLLEREVDLPAAGADPEGALPTTIGKYQVLEQLGVGAMGVVYRCSQPGLDRFVAVKVMNASSQSRADHIRRFQREARAAAGLAHPNIVPVYDVGQDGDLHYIVMEYVEGCSLAEMIGSPELTVEKTSRLLSAVALALQHAHDKGVIHRDVKPSNILMQRASGHPKLADFGLARPLLDPHAATLSNCGDLIGTPRYMSPEQVLSPPHEVDARTDVYSLGAVMYEMLTGRPPADGHHPMAVLRKVTDEEPMPVRQRNPAVPESVAAVCHRALAKDPAVRFASAREFAEALDAAASPARTRPDRRPWMVALGATVVLTIAAVVAGVWAASRMSPRPEESGGTVLAPTPAPTHPAATGEPADATSRLIAHAREHLSRSAPASDAATPRDRWRAVVDDLIAVLRHAPDHREARLLLARAYRRSGEHLAAIAEASQVLRQEPGDLDAVSERLLANYQLWVLYLHNLNEPVLRPAVPDEIVGDGRALAERGSASRKRLAGLVEALAQGDVVKAVELAQGPPPPEGGPDWFMLEADAFFRAAGAAHADEQATPEGPDREEKRGRLEEYDRRAVQALRRGLDVDPNHVGLLFLKANSFQFRAGWEAGENEDRAAVLRRQRPMFETAVNRLRGVTLRVGCDTHVARAVLASNYGRDEAALEQVTDALSCRPTLPHLHTLRAWLRFQTPPDGILTAKEVEAILRDFEPAFETPPPAFNPYFVRALLQAAVGRWEDARRDLRLCQRRLGRDALPTANPVYAEWFRLASGPAPEFLNGTLDVLWQSPVPVDLRVRVSEELVGRLASAEALAQEGVPPERTQSLKGWTHYRLALAFAEKEDRGVLRHVQMALEAKQPDLVPKTFREDGVLSAWNADPDFMKLYEQFEPPAAPGTPDP